MNRVFIFALVLMVLATISSISAQYALSIPTDPIQGGIVDLTITRNTAVAVYDQVPLNFIPDAADTGMTFSDVFIHDSLTESPVQLTGPSLETVQCTSGGKVVAFVDSDYKITYLTAFSGSSTIMCPLRLRSDVLMTNSAFITIGVGDTSVALKVPVQALSASDFTVSFGAGDRTFAGTDIKLPDTLQQFDISKLTVKYSKLPPNMLAPLHFGVVTFQDVQLPDQFKTDQKAVDALEAFKTKADDSLMSMTTTLMGFGFQSNQVQCSTDVRLVIQGLSVYIATGAAPVAGQCQLPFSRTSVALLGVVTTADKIAEFLDVGSLLQSAIDVRVSIGTIQVQVNAGSPTYPELQTTTVKQDTTTGELDITVNGFITKDNPDFEVSSTDGLAKSAVNKLRGVYGSIYDFVTRKSTTSMAVLGGNDTFSTTSLSDLIAGFKKTTLDLKAGWGAIQLKIPSGEDVDPIHVDMKLAGRKIQFAYQPIAQIQNLAVQSVTDTEMKYTLDFDHKNSAFTSYDLPLFNKDATTKVEYAIVTSNSRYTTSGSNQIILDGLWELRAPDAPFPDCTVDHPDLSIQNRTFAVSNNVDAFFNSYIVVVGSTLVSDKWTVTCTQKLNPVKKPAIPSGDAKPVLTFKLDNRFCQSIFGFLDSAKQVAHVKFDQLATGVVTWTPDELVSDAAITMKVAYSAGINTEAGLDAFITDLIAFLKAGTMANGYINPFATITKANIYFSVGETFTNHVNAHSTGLIKDIFENQYIDSWSKPGALVFLTIRPTEAITDAQINNYVRATLNDKLRVYALRLSTANTLKGFPIVPIDPTLLTEPHSMTLHGAVGSPCYSTAQCPQTTICVSSVCQEATTIPHEVRASLPSDLIPSTFSNLYFKSASSGVYSTIAIVIAVVALLF